MEKPEMLSLRDQHHAYIACLNERKWDDLGSCADAEVHKTAIESPLGQ